MSTSVPPPNMPERDPVPFELPRPPRRIPGRVKALGGVAAVVVVVVLALVAFGGGSGGGPLGPVAQAATVSTGAAGYTVRLSMSMDLGSLSTPAKVTGAGTFDLRDRSGSMSMTMHTANIPQLASALGGGDLMIREILKGTTLYMQLPAAMMSSLGGRQWVSIDIANLPGMPGIGSLMSNPASNNPGQLLEYLRAVSSNVSAVGHEQVDGLETTHYSANIDVSRLSDVLPPADRAAARQMLAMAQQSLHVDQIPVEVWVDGQHLVRRMQMSLMTSSPIGTMGVDMTMDFPYYGAEPSPPAPPAGQVADLSSLLSGLGSAGSSGGGFSGSFFGSGA